MTMGEICDLRISQLCCERGLNINQLSKLSGLTQSSLANLAAGKSRNPTVTTIQKVCIGIDITLADFFNSELFDL